MKRLLFRAREETLKLLSKEGDWMTLRGIALGIMGKLPPQIVLRFFHKKQERSRKYHKSKKINKSNENELILAYQSVVYYSIYYLIGSRIDRRGRYKSMEYKILGK